MWLTECGGVSRGVGACRSFCSRRSITAYAECGFAAIEALHVRRSLEVPISALDMAAGLDRSAGVRGSSAVATPKAHRCFT